MLSAYALLVQGYHPITFIGTSDSSTLAVGALLPRAVYTWTVPADRCQMRCSTCITCAISEVPW